MAKVIYLNTQIGGIETLPAAVGDGRTLGLNPTQFDTLKKNASAQIVAFSSKSQEQAPVESIASQPESVQAPVTPAVPETPVVAEDTVTSSVEPNEVMAGPTENTITEVASPVEPAPVIPEPVTVESPAVSPVIPDVTPVPVTSEIPAVDTTAPVMPDVAPNVGASENPTSEVVQTTQTPLVTPVIPEPVIQEEPPAPLPGQVEIVSSNPDNTDYDKLMTQIENINANYDKQIAELNQKRAAEIMEALESNKNKIIDYEAKIKDLQGRAEEHLKNAQAAETIATIAQANAQKTQDNNS